MLIPRNKYGYRCIVVPGKLVRGKGLDRFQAHHVAANLRTRLRSTGYPCVSSQAAIFLAL